MLTHRQKLFLLAGLALVAAGLDFGLHHACPSCGCYLPRPHKFSPVQHQKSHEEQGRPGYRISSQTPEKLPQRAVYWAWLYSLLFLNFFKFFLKFFGFIALSRQACFSSSELF